MQRVTVTLEDDIVEAIKAAVEAGDAPSVSSWLNEAARRRTAARAALREELDAMTREKPYDRATLVWVAEAVDATVEEVARHLGVDLAGLDGP